jgi:hypothetical protein
VKGDETVERIGRDPVDFETFLRRRFAEFVAEGGGDASDEANG